MKISIITATKNNKAGLMRAIESVRSQTYKNVEHIIVDGLSTDGSLEILKQVQNDKVQGDAKGDSSLITQNDKNANVILSSSKYDKTQDKQTLSTSSYELRAISEADSGIYDAINKGIKKATGNVIGLLHSDDFFADEFVLERVAEAFQDKRIKAKDKRVNQEERLKEKDKSILSSRTDVRDLKDFLPMAGRLTPARIRNDKDDILRYFGKLRTGKAQDDNGLTTDSPLPTTDNLPPTIDAVYSDLVYVNQKSTLPTGRQEVKGQIRRSEQKSKNDSNEYSVIRKWKTHRIVNSEQRIDNSDGIPKQPFDRLRVTHFDTSASSAQAQLRVTHFDTSASSAQAQLRVTHFDYPDGSGQAAQCDTSRMTKLLLNGWMPPHPTLFVRKEIFEKYGLYRTDMKIAADYEMVLRLFYKHKITTHYLPLTTYCMTMGGASNKSLKNIFIKSSEDYRAMKMHGIPFPLKTLFLKNVRKLPQFFQ